MIHDTTKFYVIPDQLIISMGYITTPNSKGRMSMQFFPDEENRSRYLSSPANDYIFDYDDSESIEKLVKLFEFELNKVSTITF